MARPSEWKPLGGSSRNYVNTNTGEVLSRRQFDKRFGALREVGSYERKARVNRKSHETLAKARPARGRVSHVSQVELRERTAKLQKRKRETKTGGKEWSKSRDVHIPIRQLPEDGGPDYDRLALDYSAAREGLLHNTRVFAVAINIQFIARHGLVTRNLFPARERRSQIPADVLIQTLEDNYTNMDNSLPKKLVAITLHVILTSEHMKGKK